MAEGCSLRAEKNARRSLTFRGYRRRKTLGNSDVA